MKVAIPADCEATIAKILDRCERDPDEIAYFTAFVEALEVTESVADLPSALLSRLAVTAPWMLEAAVARCSARAVHS